MFRLRSQARCARKLAALNMTKLLNTTRRRLLRLAPIFPDMQFFSVQTIAFSAFGYDLSWLELVGTIFNLWSVWLMTRNRIFSWPIGIIGVILFLMLFWQIRLYADFFEQIYYIVTGFWGWWLWQKSSAG